MSFLIFMAILFILIKLAPKPAQMAAPCTGQHKWVYDSEEHLYCEVCKRKPNYEGR